MKGLNMEDWFLIGRYLKQEASHGDLKQLDTLVDNHPNFGMELGCEMNMPTGQSLFDFDPDKAFERLNRRFELENLI